MTRPSAAYKHSVRITDQHREHLLHHGYAIVPGFLTADELAAAQSDFLRYFPTFDELHATPQRYGAIFEAAASTSRWCTSV